MSQRLSVLLAIAVALLLARPAGAIGFGTPAPEPLHDGPDLIASQADCLQDRGFTFSLIDLLPNDALEIWASAGDDCSLSASRTGSGGCTSIADLIIVTGTTTEVTLSADAISSAVPDIEACVDPGSTNVVRQMVVFFMVNPVGDVPTDNYIAMDVALDFIGPSAPTLDDLAPASPTSAAASWSPGMGESNVRYTGYCAEADAASSNGGDSESGSCSAASLVPGQFATGTPCLPAVDGTTGEVQLPDTGTLYAVGIAATDAVGNLGLLSNLRCVDPSAADDAGTTSDGGCGCAVRGRPSPAEEPLLAFAATLLGAVTRRRRRARRRRRR